MQQNQWIPLESPITQLENPIEPANKNKEEVDAQQGPWLSQLR
jgi:hypothetical protein